MTEFLTSYAGVIAIGSFIVAITSLIFAADANDRADRLAAENQRLRAARLQVAAPRQNGDHRG